MFANTHIKLFFQWMIEAYGSIAGHVLLGIKEQIEKQKHFNEVN